MTPTTRRPDLRCQVSPEPSYGIGHGLRLSQIAEADELPTNDPLALLIGMVLDWQIGRTGNEGGYRVLLLRG
ncbi:hypothetical protein [Frankia sp. R82]|uniref:hypothetical protein n=1 Tax=Frankia sp. R82 TaxID=2950553 RepID=UPI00255A908A